MVSSNESIRLLIDEVFHGTPPGASGTWFVQGNEALDVTLDDLSAAEASASPGPGVSSIAAHVIHTAYYAMLTNAWLRGAPEKDDWPSSWTRQEVSEEEWAAAKADLRAQKAELLGHLANANLAKSQEELTGALANMAHFAYHLGAIRQLYLLVKAR